MNDVVEVENIRKKRVSKNVIVNAVSKLAILLIGFIVRKAIVTLVAIEYLGLSSLYSNILDLLNLAELGIGIALQVRLYQPLVDNDFDKVSNILSVARKIYMTIGMIVVVLGIGATFLLQFVIKDNPFDIWYVRGAFLISVAGIASSYFMADKRLYYEANETMYIVTTFDLVAKIVVNAVGLLALWLSREYIFYLLATSFAMFTSNFLLWLKYKIAFRKRTFTKDIAFQKEEFGIVRKNMKEVIPNKLSVFVFTSTDSVVISSFIGLTAVGLYSNYNILFLAFLIISTTISSAICSTFGKMFKETDDFDKIYSKFLLYEAFQFAISSFTAICLFTLSNKFITFWLGVDFLLDKTFVLIFAADYFIHSLFQPMSAIISGKAMFKEDKICSIISAILNIVISIILVNFIGLYGVILGTLVSNLFNIISRIVFVYRNIFKRDMVKRYIALLIQIVLVGALGYATMLVVDLIHFDSAFVDFLVSGFTAFGISNVLNIVLIFLYFKKKRSIKYELN